MRQLDQEQIALERSKRKTSLIWGVFGFALLGVLVLCLLGKPGKFLNIAAALVVGVSAGFGVFKWKLHITPKS